MQWEGFAVPLNSIWTLSQILVGLHTDSVRPEGWEKLTLNMCNFLTVNVNNYTNLMCNLKL